MREGNENNILLNNFSLQEKSDSEFDESEKANFDLANILFGNWMESSQNHEK